MIVESLADARKAIRRKGVSSVSFVGFGGLLLRRCMNMEAVYEHTLSFVRLPEGTHLPIDSYVQHRNLAGNKALFDRLQDKTLPGVGMKQVFDRLALRAMALPLDLTPALIEAEIKAECDLAFVNPEIRSLYDEARTLGKRVGILSDDRWSSEQLRRILAAVAPDLRFDFIYSVVDGACGGATLFRHYLAEEKIAAKQAVHIGQEFDNIALPTAGVKRIPYSLPKDPWEGLYEREETTARLLQMSDSRFRWRLDGGLRLARGLTMAELGQSDCQSRVAAAVLGPSMLGFHIQAEALADKLRAEGRKVQVLFLARDAYLSHRVWGELGKSEAIYIELNRRIAMIAASEGEDGYGTLSKLFEAMSGVTVPAVEQFFKIKLSAKAKAVFEEAGGQLTGPEFASRMAVMVGGRKRLLTIAGNMREAMLDYLRVKLGPLEDCQDLILVDIGYTGNIQRGLRRVFDRLGLKIRLHGLYLMPHGEAFATLPEGDTVQGYFDDTVMIPSVKRAVMRDGPLVEEFCCAPVGSTRGYADGKEIRETDVRLPQEIAFCMQMQEEVLRFITSFRRILGRLGIDPTSDFERFRAWSAAIMARFVAMPTGLECQTFGPLLHDVSLGSKGLIATITTQDIENLMGTLPFPAVCSISHPPVWLGGSMMAHSAASGLAYSMCGLGLAHNDLLSDVPVGQMMVLILKGEQGTPVPVSVLLTPFGDIRLRIPVLAKDTDSMIGIPLVAQMERGIIRSLMRQEGETVAAAAETRFGQPLPMEEVQVFRALLDGSYVRATEPEAYLLLPVPASDSTISLINLQFTPLFR